MGSRCVHRACCATGRRALLIALIATLACAARDACALADGYFDPGFAGTGGFVFFGDPYDSTVGYDTTRFMPQPNGNLFVAGSGFRKDPSKHKWWLGEILQSGAWSPFWGVSDLTGRVTNCNFGLDCAGVVYDRLVDALVQKDGKFLVLSEAYLTRTNLDARSLDYPGIAGGTGVVDYRALAFNTLNGSIDFLRALAVQPDGKVLLAGSFWYSQSHGTEDFYMGAMRLNADLSLDQSFNAVTINQVNYAGGSLIGYAKGQATAMVLQRNGGIILVGRAFQDPNSVFNFYLDVVRLLPAGGFDAAFATGGYAQLENPLQTSYEAATVDRSDRIVIAYEVGAKTIHTVRLNANGTPDLTFGAGMGISIVDATTCIGKLNIRGVAIDSAGRILVAGWCEALVAGSYYFVVVRLRGDTGALDSSFGAGGVSLGWFNTTSLSPQSGFATTISFGTDGRPLISGASIDPGGSAGVSRLGYDLIWTNNFDAFARGCISPNCN